MSIPNLVFLWPWTAHNVPWCDFWATTKYETKSKMATGGHLRYNKIVKLHNWFAGRRNVFLVKMIQTAIIKQQIFILKNCRFKYTCNDDNSIGRRKQQKLAYHIVACKFPITSLQCHDVLIFHSISAYFELCNTVIVFFPSFLPIGCSFV